MKVDGSAFKKARKKIRNQAPPKIVRGEPTYGTQAWLAKQAHISIRLVQNLEKSPGEASKRTLDLVSQVLGIDNWEEHVIDVGLEYVTCKIEKYIDFRPELFPHKYPNKFAKSVTLMTFDPVVFCAESGKRDHYELQDLKATITGLESNINFSWYAEVSLTSDMKTWLGKKQDIDSLTFNADNQPVSTSIMLRQDGMRISWEKFVQMVEKPDVSYINIEIELLFSQFSKKQSFSVCVDCLRRLFVDGREKYTSIWPYRAQVRVINPTHTDQHRNQGHKLS